MDNDVGAMEAMRKAHMEYAAERYALLSEEHKRLVEDMNWVEALKDRGTYLPT